MPPEPAATLPPVPLLPMYAVPKSVELGLTLTVTPRGLLNRTSGFVSELMSVNTDVFVGWERPVLEVPVVLPVALIHPWPDDLLATMEKASVEELRKNDCVPTPVASDCVGPPLIE